MTKFDRNFLEGVISYLTQGLKLFDTYFGGDLTLFGRGLNVLDTKSEIDTFFLKISDPFKKKSNFSPNV